MKLTKFYFPGVLAILCCTCLSSCKGSGPEKKELAFPTVHEVNLVDNPGRKFTSPLDGSLLRTTEYSVVYNEQVNIAARCASFLSRQLGDATSATFPVYSLSEYTVLGYNFGPNDKVIAIGCREAFTKDGLTFPEKVHTTAGYYIKNVRNKFYIEANDSYGYQEATLAFARNTVDYDMIEEDTIVFEDPNIETLPDMEIIERPDYQGNTPTNNFTADKRFGIGFDMTYPFMMVTRPDGKTGRNWHNVFDFAPIEMYGLEHPKWYADNNQQMCYSAHGDAAEYEAMVKQFAQVGINSLNDHLDCPILNITSNDIGSSCECDACLALKEKDGASSGQVIRFMNDVDKIIQAEMKKQNRVSFELFFAYLGYQSAPTTTVEADPTLKCNDQVMVCVAPLHAIYTKTFYDEVNKEFADQFVNWSKYCSNIVAWLYETNYHHYMYPYNTYSTMMDNYRYARENGATIILNEGQRKSANVPCFGHLKEYLCSKSQFDITSNFNEYSDKFFKYYYLDAAEIMRKYFEELIAWETKLENDPTTGLGGGVYEEIGSNASFWPKQLLLNWLSMLDQATSLIAKYEATDLTLYKKLVKHINIERLFPMFCLCDKHADSYTQSEILALRKEFKALADDLGLIEFAEHDGDISIKYNEWGIN